MPGHYNNAIPTKKKILSQVSRPKSIVPLPQGQWGR